MRDYIIAADNPGNRDTVVGNYLRAHPGIDRVTVEARYDETLAAMRAGWSPEVVGGGTPGEPLSLAPTLLRSRPEVIARVNTQLVSATAGAGPLPASTPITIRIGETAYEGFVGAPPPGSVAGLSHMHLTGVNYGGRPASCPTAPRSRGSASNTRSATGASSPWASMSRT